MTMEGKTAPLLILGSPHKEGPTRALARAFLQREGLAEADCRLFDAYDARPLPCIDCGRCKTDPGCALPDLKDFYRDFEAARLVIIAAPVYNAGLPAPLKAVADRMQTYFNARFSRGLRPPIPTSKKAVLLFTAGSGRDYRPLLHEQLAPLFTVTNCKLHGAACLSELDRRPADAPRIADALSAIPPLSRA